MAKFTKKLADLIHAVAGSPQNETAAILVAAGNSERMGEGVSKQLIPLCGIPVVVHALRSLEEADRITSVVVSAREEEIPFYREFKEKYHLTKLCAVVKGGNTRQESVLAALEKIPDSARYVAISDAARCLILPEQINRVCYDAYTYGAAIAATPATDTVKQAEKDGMLSTPDRNKLWLATTPQVFGADLYRAATYTAQKEGFSGTDDAALVEHIGHPVHLTDIGRWNLKITTPEDLPVAEAILRARKEQAT